MIDLRDHKGNREFLKSYTEDCTEITAFHDINSLHRAIHQFKTDYPDKRGFANFNDIYFFTDDLDLSIENLYLAITGKSRTERLHEQEKHWIESQKRKFTEKQFYCHNISSFIKQGLAVLAPECHEEWIDLVPVRVMDLYNGYDLESFLELHHEIANSTFEKAKNVFESQGHSGMSASGVFLLLEKFSPNGKAFVEFLKKRGGR